VVVVVAVVVVVVAAAGAVVVGAAVAVVSVFVAVSVVAVSAFFPQEIKTVAVRSRHKAMDNVFFIGNLLDTWFAMFPLSLQ
jgi:hypothetical protein